MARLTRVAAVVAGLALLGTAGVVAFQSLDGPYTLDAARLAAVAAQT